jgi:hypothetical protein
VSIPPLLPSPRSRFVADKVDALSTHVTAIYHTDQAFAALKDDESVVMWSQAGHGGSPGATTKALPTSAVHMVCANDVAFSTIKADGSVVAWGHDVSIAAAGVQFAHADLVQGTVCGCDAPVSFTAHRSRVIMMTWWAQGAVELRLWLWCARK